ncbi:MAG TPA: ATP-binding protein [Gammaproteobacteria bacterium]|nr:ATP-binding protein [Gammaproteobacteria bacterium]
MAAKRSGREAPGQPQDGLQRFLARAEEVLDRVEQLVPAPPAAPDWNGAVAFRWRRNSRRGWLDPVRHPHRLRLTDLRGVDEQKRELDRNTRQFLAGAPANNALLWGSRGTGKSSLVKALLNAHARDGLRLIEVDKADLVDLADIVDLLYARPERFVLFCDDLSFEADDPSYKTLKAVLDGSITAAPDNVVVYATSNRRHLLPEYQAENQEARLVGGEIHHGEAVEEKISLSERFGLWLSFYPFDQDAYLAIVFHWLKRLKVTVTDRDAVRQAALQWALARGSRSGRVAWQFARDWAGRAALEHPPA